MSRAEVDLAVDWAADEGWNPGLDDAAAFWAADPTGFHIGLTDGRPAAVCSMVKYEPGFAFGGFYIVRPDLRGTGCGWALSRRVLESVSDRVVGLDGVPEQVATYAKAGFVEEFRSVRYRSSGGGQAPQGLTDLSGLDFSAVAAYDRTCFPTPRPGFLKVWLSPPGGTALGVVRQGVLKGYGVIRPCREGFKIGPLFADDPADADLIFRGLSAEKKISGHGGPVYLDIPEPNRAGGELVNRHGMEPVFSTARMYRGSAPELNLDRVFGITSFELG